MSSQPRTQPVPDRVADKNASNALTDDFPGADAVPSTAAVGSESPGRNAAAVGGGLLLAGVALAAANMRPAVTSLATLLGEVRDSLGATTTWASIVTSVPTLCFGIASLGAPLLARRWGINRVIGVALAVLTAAMLARVIDGPWTVLAATVLVCGAIAMCNVLIPVVVKASFPHRIGMATGLYTTAMAGGGAIGSAFTPWLKSSTGSWRLALATWAVVALAALCVWVSATRRGTPIADASRPSGARRSLLRSPLAWVVTAYFAMQSLIAYVVMGWMPEVFKSAGMDSTSAGALLGVLLLVGVPSSMVLPPLVTRTRSQSGWAVGLASMSVLGVLGLLLAPMSAPILWALLIGLGISAFPLALTLMSLRTRDAADTGQLSAMSQSAGYLIASAGPFLFGVLHDATAGWRASLTALLVIVVAQGIVGIVAGRPRTI
jgi:MFS transporter, CP family, cyanate transporter